MKKQFILFVILIFSSLYVSAKDSLVYSFKTKEMVTANIDKPILVVQENCSACDALMLSYKAELEAKKIIVVAMFQPTEGWMKETYPLKNDLYNYLGVKEKIGFKGHPRATPALITKAKDVAYGSGKILKKLGIKQK